MTIICKVARFRPRSVRLTFTLSAIDREIKEYFLFHYVSNIKPIYEIYKQFKSRGVSSVCLLIPDKSVVNCLIRKGRRCHEN